MAQLLDEVLESKLAKTDFHLIFAEASCEVQGEQLVKGYAQLEAFDFYFQIRFEWLADPSSGGEPFLPDFIPTVFTGAEVLNGNGYPLSPQAKEALCRKILSRMEWQTNAKKTFSILRLVTAHSQKNHCTESYKVRLFSRTFTKTESTSFS